MSDQSSQPERTPLDIGEDGDHLLEESLASSAPIGRKVGAGVAWVMIAFMASKGLGVVLQVTLGYLLSPAEMGVWAATLGFYGFMLSVRDAGVTSLLVQRGEREYPDLIGPAFWLSTAFHAMCALLIVAIGLVLPILQTEKHAIGHTLLYCSLAMLAMAVGTVSQTRLRMQLRFRNVSMIVAISAFIRAAIVITGAVLGFGAISFALGLIMMSLFESVAMSRATGEKIWAHPARVKRWPSLLRATRWNIAVALAASALAVGDWAALSMIVPDAVIGIYYQGVQLMMQAEQAIAGTASQVLFPSFANLKNEPVRLANALLRTLRSLSLMASPISLAIALVGDPLIKFVWPSGRWDESIPCLAALSFFAAFRICNIAPLSLLQAKGQFKQAFFAMLAIGGSLFTSALIAGLLFKDSPLRIAMCTGFTLGPVSLIVALIVAKSAGASRRETLVAIVRPWVLAVVIAMALYVADRYAVRAYLGANNLTAVSRFGQFVRLVLEGATFCALYAALARLVLRGAIHDALTIMPARISAIGRRVLRVPVER